MFKITCKRWRTGLLVGMFVMGCGNQPSDAAPTDGWVRECPGNAFCFMRPGTLVAQPGQVIDSLAARYLGNGMLLTFDMGRYGTSSDHLVNPVQETATIDGRPAQVLTSEHEIVLVVPKVYERGPTTVKFNMALHFDGKPSRDVARRIFQSIAFTSPR